MLSKSLEGRAKNTVLFVYLIIYLMLSEYSPGRDSVYSVHGFFLIFLAFSYYLLIAIIQKKIYFNKLSIVPIFFYVCLLPFLITSSLLGLDYKGSSQLRGAVNNLVYQLVFIGLVYFYISKNRVSQFELAGGLAWLLLIHALLASLAAFQLHFTGGVLFGLIYFESKRWPQLYGWFQSPNFFVNAISLGLISALFLIFSRLYKKSVFLLTFLSTASLFLILVALLSGSKGGVLFLVFSIFFSSVLVLLSRIDKFSLVRSFYFIVIFLVVVFFVIFSMIYFLNVSGNDARWLLSSVLRLQSISDGTGRLGLWLDSFEILISADFYQLAFGHGNNYIISTYGSSTHNAHLKVIVEYGFLVYFLLLSVFFYIIYSAVKLARRGNRTLGFFVSCIVLFAWFRPLLNAGLFTAGLLGFSFILAIFMVSYKKNINYENSLSF